MQMLTRGLPRRQVCSTALPFCNSGVCSANVAPPPPPPSASPPPPPASGRRMLETPIEPWADDGAGDGDGDDWDGMGA